MFKRQPTDTHFIIVTLVLVLMLGIPTFDVFTSDEEVVESLAHQQTVAPSDQRSPASVPPVKVDVRSALARFTQYDVSCDKKSSAKLNVVGGYVQFQGKNCVKNFKDGDIEIVNRSNGYTASIFKSGSDKYQTDLIQLKDGDNEIVIRYRERSGKAVDEVVRVRSSQI